jgi:hypothetical protein
MDTVDAKYNPDDKIVISGTVDTVAPAVFTWSAPSLNATILSGAVLTSLTKTITSSSKLSSTFYLSLRDHSLTAGLTYTFQLSAAYSANLTATNAYAQVKNTTLFISNISCLKACCNYI